MRKVEDGEPLGCSQECRSCPSARAHTLTNNSPFGEANFPGWLNTTFAWPGTASGSVVRSRNGTQSNTISGENEIKMRIVFEVRLTLGLSRFSTLCVFLCFSWPFSESLTCASCWYPTDSYSCEVPPVPHQCGFADHQPEQRSWQKWSSGPQAILRRGDVSHRPDGLPERYASS